MKAQGISFLSVDDFQDLTIMWTNRVKKMEDIDSL